MKKSHFFVSALILQTGLAFASTPPAQVERLDNAREGDLAARVAAFYDQSPSAASCAEAEIGRTVAYKISSDSSHEEKVVGTKTDYQADYLVVKFCFSGSTFVGAYREAKDAVVVTAKRRGVENAAGAIVPSEPDQIQIVKKVDRSAILSGQN